jgi:antitoxin component YwqK of YwqJK toxin-antitoxin module
MASVAPNGPSYPDTTMGRLGDNKQFHIQLNDSLRTLEEYYPNGIKAYQATFIYNDYHGEATSWYNTGQIMRSAIYNKGKLNGACTSWDEHGNIKNTVYFQNGNIVDHLSYSSDPSGNNIHQN